MLSIKSLKLLQYQGAKAITGFIKSKSKVILLPCMVTMPCQLLYVPLNSISTFEKILVVDTRVGSRLNLFQCLYKK